MSAYCVSDSEISCYETASASSDDIELMECEQCILPSENYDSDVIDNEKELTFIIRNTVEEYQSIVKSGLLKKVNLLDVVLNINSQAKNDCISNHNLNLVHRLIFNPFEKYGPMYYGIGHCNWLVLAFLIIFYLLYTISDLTLSINYAIEGRILYSALTLMCIIAPSCCYTFAIYSINDTLTNVFILILNISPFLRCYNLIKRALRLNSLSKGHDIDEQEHCFKELSEEYESLNKMKQLVGFLSCFPQLTLQVVIFLTFVRRNVDFDWKGLHWFSIGTSIIGLLIALESRFKNLLVEIVWLLPIITARVLTLCVLTYRYPTSTLLFLGIHWLTLFIWWYVNEVRYMQIYQSTREKILYAATEALVITFVPLKFLHLDLNKYLYICYFIQNVIANIIWVSTVQDLVHSSYLYILVFCINVTYFIIGIIGFFYKVIPNRI